MKVVRFTKEDFEAFKDYYDKAVKEDAESFEFKGNEYVTDYAKYMIEYYESEIEKR